MWVRPVRTHHHESPCPRILAVVGGHLSAYSRTVWYAESLSDGEHRPHPTGSTSATASRWATLTGGSLRFNLSHLPAADEGQSTYPASTSCSAYKRHCRGLPRAVLLAASARPAVVAAPAAARRQAAGGRTEQQQQQRQLQPYLQAPSLYGRGKYTCSGQRARCC